jgi:hypothetical protein
LVSFKRRSGPARAAGPDLFALGGRGPRGGAGTLGLRLILVAPLVLLLAMAACSQPAARETATIPPPPSELAPESYAPPAGTPGSYPPVGTPSPVEGTEHPGYPGPTVEGEATPRAAANITAVARVFAPLIQRSAQPTPTPTSTPTRTPSPTPTPTPTIDFRAVRAELLAQGQELGFVKLGLHTGAGGNRNGLGDWMRRLDAAGVPFFLKAADDTGPLVEAQNIARTSETPHVLVYRRTGDAYDTPDYSLPPAAAARDHWRLHMEAFPPELDRHLIWLETINEVDRNRSEWLGQFAVETARLAMADGFRWAAFGWSSGEPELSDWQQPSMLAFLRLAAANPDRLAIAVHEYSYLVDDIGHEYPFKLGRFQHLFRLCDQLGIPRPTVLITEWGWTYQNVPDAGRAIADIAWAAELYAPYPQLKGAAIWYLGGGYGEIADQTQALIRPLTEFALGNYYAIPLPPEQAPIAPERHQP